jgi:parallel beta-helix repeat protein
MDERVIRPGRRVGRPGRFRHRWRYANRQRRSRNVVSNNSCYSNGSSGDFNGICVFGAGSNDNLVTNDYCYYNGSIGIGGGHGISIDGVSTGLNFNNIVSGNTCTTNKQLGIELRYAESTRVINNICLNNNQNRIVDTAGIGLDRYVSYSIITGNQAFDNQNKSTQIYGISETPGKNNDYNIVTDNIVYGNIRTQVLVTGANSIALNNLSESPSNGYPLEYTFVGSN